jgi:hypothetical protein
VQCSAMQCDVDMSVVGVCRCRSERQGKFKSQSSERIDGHRDKHKVQTLSTKYKECTSGSMDMPTCMYGSYRD